MTDPIWFPLCIAAFIMWMGLIHDLLMESTPTRFILRALIIKHLAVGIVTVAIARTVASDWLCFYVAAVPTLGTLATRPALNCLVRWRVRREAAAYD